MTVYQDWFPSSQLELIFDLEADRVQYLAFDPKIVESERQVVYSERRLSVDNNNFGLLDEQLEATAMMAHPYHWPVIGWPSDIEKWTLDDLKAYFSKGYSPSNATMVVVGGVKADEVFRLAEKYMEPIPAHDPPSPVRTVEPKQLGERRISVHKFAQLPIVEIAYHVPQALGPDYYTLEVLQAILTTGESSRLYRSLVDQQQLAIAVQSSHDATFDPFLFTFTVQPRQGVAPEKAEQALYAEVEKLKASGVDEHELQKAKNQVISSHYRSLRSINRRANVIGRYELLFGDYRKLADVEQEFNKVSTADIQRAAAVLRRQQPHGRDAHSRRRAGSGRQNQVREGETMRLHPASRIVFLAAMSGFRSRAGASGSSQPGLSAACLPARATSQRIDAASSRKARAALGQH